ncbi:alpha/beta fold hydrolase [uncultured Sphingomonas sp.]|uniref:alpha/beta hydrolase n=1 Tax=uncultured Sphingomonas sp. TaxID=158754 RepID=UPI00260D5917|nr:alpha/beta fold hydrolase [uncultured Sphingomonas sp.]
MLIDGAHTGLKLFLRNKRPVDRDTTGSLLLVHGATFPSLSLFDVDVGGFSFMDALAEAGIDAWALDVRGYGGSTRPAPMNEEPSNSTPLARAVDAADDVASALAHIRSLRSPSRVGLLGMSWGGSIAGIHASRHHDLDALILVAPLWLSSIPLRFDGGAPITSHRVVDAATYRTAWVGSAPEAQRDGLLPEGWFQRWVEVTEATDPDAPAGYLRAPSGAVADVREHWTAGRPLYDPAAITTPTLVIRGSWDVDVRRDMALDLVDRLTSARDRAYLEVAGGTHMMLMEPVRKTAFGQIVSYLDTMFSD